MNAITMVDNGCEAGATPLELDDNSNFGAAKGIKSLFSFFL